MAMVYLERYERSSPVNWQAATATRGASCADLRATPVTQNRHLLNRPEDALTRAQLEWKILKVIVLVGEIAIQRHVDAIGPNVVRDS